jgi:hypothetical protein
MSKPLGLLVRFEEYTLPQVKAGTLRSFHVDVYEDYSNAGAARPDAPATLDLNGASSVWYSTGNLLNATNPC